LNALDNTIAGSRQSLMDYFDLLTVYNENRQFTTGGLAQGTGTATSVKVASTVTYLASGVFKSKTTAEVAFTTTTHDIPANASLVQERVYMITVNAAGTLAISAGSIASGAGNALLPERPADGICPIGYLRITVAAGASPFTANTTNPVTAGAITAVYTDGYPAPRFSGTR
jgi:hypothetical protein